MRIITMPDLDALCRPGPSGYVPTPDDAPSRREIRRHEAAADEADAVAAAIMADVAAIEAQAGVARREATVRRVEAWSAIARVRTLAAIDARRWLHCSAVVVAAADDQALDPE